MMEQTQKLIVTLLVIAIVFSVASIALNLSLLDFDTVSAGSPRTVIREHASNSGPQPSGINLVIESGEEG